MIFWRAAALAMSSMAGVGPDQDVARVRLGLRAVLVLVLLVVRRDLVVADLGVLIHHPVEVLLEQEVGAHVADHVLFGGVVFRQELLERFRASRHRLELGHVALDLLVGDGDPHLLRRLDQQLLLHEALHGGAVQALVLGGAGHRGVGGDVLAQEVGRDLLDLGHA